MKPLACRYSIVQFSPYVETGEFANIGIVMICPQQGSFRFLLQDKRAKRITDFFDSLERGHYMRTVRAVQEQLARIHKEIRQTPKEVRADALRHALNALAQPKEAIIRFSQPRVLLSLDPRQELRKKFDHYVDHSFATPEYIENTMNSQIRGLLSSLSLVAPFRPERIGNEQMHARFDFVQTIDGNPIKVIKALNLSHKDPTEIAAHGDVWLGKVRRLQENRRFPRNALFNVALPEENNTARHNAGLEIMRSLERQRIIVVPGNGSEANKRIREFAES